MYSGSLTENSFVISTYPAKSLYRTPNSLGIWLRLGHKFCHHNQMLMSMAYLIARGTFCSPMADSKAEKCTSQSIL